MKYEFQCDSCETGIQVAEYSEEDIRSMEEMRIDWKNMKGRCPKCEAALQARLYPKPRPQAEPKALSQEEVRARLPIAKLSQPETPRIAKKACSRCHDLYDERWLDQDGECPKCQGAEKPIQGELL